MCYVVYEENGLNISVKAINDLYHCATNPQLPAGDAPSHWRRQGFCFYNGGEDMLPLAER